MSIVGEGMGDGGWDSQCVRSRAQERVEILVQVGGSRGCVNRYTRQASFEVAGATAGPSV